MSINYYLICMDCKEVLDIGKIIQLRSLKSGVEYYGFDGIGGLKDTNKPPILHYELIEAISFFFMKHRHHELRILPDSIGKLQATGGLSISYEAIDYDELDIFLSQPTQKPSVLSEIENLPKEVIEKIRKL